MARDQGCGPGQGPPWAEARALRTGFGLMKYPKEATVQSHWRAPLQEKSTPLVDFLVLMTSWWLKVGLSLSSWLYPKGNSHPSLRERLELRGRLQLRGRKETP